jgi:hypothetical protein
MLWVFGRQSADDLLSSRCRHDLARQRDRVIRQLARHDELVILPVPSADDLGGARVSGVEIVIHAAVFTWVCPRYYGRCRYSGPPPCRVSPDRTPTSGRHS